MRIVPCTVGDENEAHTQPAPGALSHAGPGVPILLLCETPFAWLGPEVP